MQFGMQLFLLRCLMASSGTLHMCILKSRLVFSRANHWTTGGYEDLVFQIYSCYWRPKTVSHFPTMFISRNGNCFSLVTGNSYNGKDWNGILENIIIWYLHIQGCRKMISDLQKWTNYWKFLTTKGQQTVLPISNFLDYLKSSINITLKILLIVLF